MTKIDIIDLQRALNHFTRRCKLGVTPLKVDGEMGRATRKRVKLCKYWLGYPRENVNSYVGDGHELMWRLNHARSIAGPWHVTKAGVQRGKARRAAHRRHVAANHVVAVFKPGVSHFDGQPVANPFIPYMQWARAHDWQGHLVSGYRTPPYSESLCYAMCGAPKCSGRCAGRSSRHSQTTLYGGAIDVSDYAKFKQLMAACPLRPQLHNVLGSRDPVHFSVVGN